MHLRRFKFTGADAADFLQRLSTVDISRLETRQQGCFLTATGKITALFWIEPGFVIDVDPGREGRWRQSLEAFIDKFTFGEDVVLRADGDSPVELPSERERIEKLIPAVDREIELEATNPLEVNLAGAISRDKGCYPGQEVIEKIYTYGEPPRRLVRLTGAGALDPSVGKITTQAGGQALAIVKKIRLKEKRWGEWTLEETAPF